MKEAGAAGAFVEREAGAALEHAAARRAKIEHTSASERLDLVSNRTVPPYGLVRIPWYGGL